MCVHPNRHSLFRSVSHSFRSRRIMFHVPPEMIKKRRRRKISIVRVAMNLSSRTGCSISRFIVTHATNELHTPNDRTHNDVADCTATGRMRHIRRKMKRKFNIKSGRLQMDGRYYLQMLSECIKCDTHGSFPCPFRRLCPYAEWVADKSTQQNIVADGIAQFQRCRRVLSISMANT